MNQRTIGTNKIAESDLSSTAQHLRDPYPLHTIFKNSKHLFNRVPLGVVHGDAPPRNEFMLNIITRPTPIPINGTSFIEIPLKLFYKRPYGTGILEVLNRVVAKRPHNNSYIGWYVSYDRKEFPTVDGLMYDCRVLRYIRTVVAMIYPQLLCGWFMLPQTEHAQTILPYHMVEEIHTYDFLPVRDRWSRLVAPSPQQSSWYGGYPQWWAVLPIRIPLLIARAGRAFWRGTFDEGLYRDEIRTYVHMAASTVHRLLGVGFDCWWSKEAYCDSLVGTKLEELLCTYGWFNRQTGLLVRK